MSASEVGHPIVDEPQPLPVRWGDAELARLTTMVKQRSLFYWKGPQTEALYEAFRRRYPLTYCFATSSGSAALHVAVAALRLQPGDEVIVPAITDMGSVIGILYQQAVPVFADLEPGTYNLDPADVRRRITPKTRAIMPVHLAGNPCDMQALMALAREHRLAVIEDCAQAWGARWQGEPVGLQGDLACYSFNEFKHVSCGDGGVVGTNRDALGRGLGKWGDKFYDREAGGRDPLELAPNYRISEPQAAVATAQLGKLEEIVTARVRAGSQLLAELDGTSGLRLPMIRRGDTHSFWFFLLRLEPGHFRVSRDEFAAALNAEGVSCTAGYIPRPVYQYPVFQNHNFFGGHWPIREFGLTQMDYRTVHCPEAEAILKDSIKLTINEAMGEAYVAKVARAVRVVAERAQRRAGVTG
ncbi:DegT/DnrJ/EryC1/StrS family aminotransferase [Opitutus sp. ER46]|uniref:DegT/DnrJ/EryC1/StrS family aminotransferase n=1 Tax=Opitutus sp. ER46 TaxID=2161864 RepID=UPI000D325B42|nr:DegT/DnrJ/EryC1/StrS family aminotransferase [Opitutus sp. ER46]PTX94488.1 glutamine--scyllo-inositol aminotransferase [Opitutus sp. ER46]